MHASTDCWFTSEESGSHPKMADGAAGFGLKAIQRVEHRSEVSVAELVLEELARKLFLGLPGS